jgi:anti-sigma regulatory factor (Ser/Thr protein kinase)
MTESGAVAGVSGEGGGARTVRIDLRAGGVALADGLALVRGLLVGAGASERTVYHTLLVFEELASNVLKYGHPGGGEGVVTAEVSVGATAVEVAFEDDGVAFNPLEHAFAPRPSSVAEAPVGGLGLLLARHFADALTYERRGAMNLVRARIDAQ